MRMLEFRGILFPMAYFPAYVSHNAVHARALHIKGARRRAASFNIRSWGKLAILLPASYSHLSTEPVDTKALNRMMYLFSPCY